MRWRQQQILRVGVTIGLVSRTPIGYKTNQGESYDVIFDDDGIAVAVYKAKARN